MLKSKAIAEAINNVQSEIKRQATDKTNSYGNYKYLGIDGYYSMIRPLLVKNQIVILCNEIDCDLINNKYLKATYEFSIVHSNGDVWESGIKRTVILPYTGGQSCGSSLSYAEKFFIRTTFKIDTGERDDTEENNNEIEDTASNDSDIDSMPTQTFYIHKDGEAVQSFTNILAWGKAIQQSLRKGDVTWEENKDEVLKIEEFIVKNIVRLQAKKKEELLLAINTLKLQNSL